MLGTQVRGLDISTYAIENSHPEVKGLIEHGTAARLSYPDNEFDLDFSINTLHNLHNHDLGAALRELKRVGKNKYLCVESYRNELEKTNLRDLEKPAGLRTAVGLMEQSNLPSLKKYSALVFSKHRINKLIQNKNLFAWNPVGAQAS